MHGIKNQALDMCFVSLYLYEMLQVYKVAWWMGHYNHPTPKRSKGYSNNRFVLHYDKGRLSRAKMSSVKPEHQTTKRYKDARGKSRFTGLPGLKKSQTLR